MTFTEKDLSDIYNALSETGLYANYQDVVARYTNAFDNAENIINFSIQKIFEYYYQARKKIDNEGEEAAWDYFASNVTNDAEGKKITLDFTPLTDKAVIDEFKENLVNMKSYVEMFDFKLEQTYQRRIKQFEMQLSSMQQNGKAEIVDSYYQGRIFGYTESLELNRQMRERTLDSLRDEVRQRTYVRKSDDELGEDVLTVKPGERTYISDFKNKEDEKLKCFNEVWNKFLENENSYKKKDEKFSERETLMLKKGLLDTMDLMQNSNQFDISEKSKKFDTQNTLYQSLVGMHEVFRYSNALSTGFERKEQTIFNPSDEFLKATCRAGYQRDFRKQDWESVAANWMKYKQGRTTKELEDELKLVQKDYDEWKKKLDNIKANKTHPDGSVTNRRSFDKAWARAEYDQHKINYLTSELSKRANFFENAHIQEKTAEPEIVKPIEPDKGSRINGPDPHVKQIGESEEGHLQASCYNIVNKYKDDFEKMNFVDNCAIVVYRDENNNDLQVAIIANPEKEYGKKKASCTLYTENEKKEDFFITSIDETEKRSYFDNTKNKYCMSDENGKKFFVEGIFTLDKNANVTQKLNEILGQEKNLNFRSDFNFIAQQSHTESLPARTNTAPSPQR